MRTLQHLLLSLALIIALSSCENNRAAAPPPAIPEAPVTTQERVAPPTPRPAPAELPDDQTAESDETTESIIADIRNKYAAITAKMESKLLQEKKNTLDCDYGGVAVSRYYDGEELVVLEHSGGSDHYFMSNMVYFSNGKPFFVFEQDGSWQFGGPLNDDDSPNTIDKFMEKRLYLKDGKIVKALHKNWENKSWEKEVLSDDVPNTPNPELIGEEYEKMGEVAEWVKGQMEC